MKHAYTAAVLLSLSLLSSPALAQTKRIVTYIEDVQEERKSTRWTLTEWLRIKERMKLMDLWLAMFSKPQEKFAPEVVLSYAKGVGEAEFRLLPSGGEESQIRGTSRSEEAKLEFWFTNLVSGTTGLRTLDIDIGLEGKVANRFMEGGLNVDAAAGDDWRVRTDKLSQAGVNLRIFGTSSQDSGLVIKGGKFEKDSGLRELDKLSGTYWGGQLSLYLLSFLGAEGNYYQYLDGKKKVGSTVDAMGFLELYNVRVGYGQAKRDWSFDTEASSVDTKDFDRYLSVRLYF